MQTCSRCDDCATQSCVSGIPGCSAFLARLYSSCRQWEEGSGSYVDTLMTFAFFAGAIVFLSVAARACAGTAGTPAMESRRQARLAMSQSGSNGPGILSARWQGTYSENGETKPTQYQWTTNGGFAGFAGTSTDDDGAAQVVGSISWQPGQESGQIAWSETRPGASLEASGTIGFAQQAGFMDMFGERGLQIEASYDSSTGVPGTVSLKTTEVQFGAASKSQAPQALPNLPPGGRLHNHAGGNTQESRPLILG
mmetsp:Transcript_184/g.530  ORF Transcript_184/g.530 Transcript_184/m.530 type:complete len:253 (+) Transcript_184:190-948(+)